MGYSETEAFENLQHIREHTYKGVKEWRIQLAEEVWTAMKKKIDMAEVEE
eukprot:CAMPEP_0197002252 /NCGR_PEP_ID=MMETSP1380-20130617/6784_1 /TAXON_ID=5936 /ORGANISM="Euplotes crassus, Strain CT5" /LENGTH=49 /DNA_ID= /DNA_START= /DNA_END= /DNA_ORIENTATION=